MVIVYTAQYPFLIKGFYISNAIPYNKINW